MAVSDAIWTPVLPSFKDFGRELDKGTKGAGKSAGEKIAAELEAAVKKSEKSVATAGAAAERAHNRVADAAGRVRVSEEALAKARESGDAVKIARAEEQLAANRRKLGEATTNAEAADRKLGDAQKSLTSAQEASAKAAAENEAAISGVAMSSEEAAAATARFEDATKVLAVGLAGLVAAGGAVSAGLYDLGSQFDDMNDTIRIGTGASGAAFDELKDSALRVAQTVPAMDGGLAQIGSTMADLNTRLGASGEDLEVLSGQFLQLQNMGIDADINSVSQALSGFGVSAAEAPAAMDELFQISQATGLTITELADSAVKGGPQLRQFGFDMADSAALIGSLDKAGLDADKTLAGMSRAMVKFAEDGREPKQALFETITEVENLTAAGNDVAALDLAGQIFGTRGAGQFVDAVKSGQLSVEDFAASAGLSGDTIMGVAEETADFAEQWQLFKQMLAVELAPVAEKVFGGVADAMTWVKDHAIPAAAGFVQTLRDWSGPLMTAGVLVGALATGMYAYTAAQAIAAAGGFLAWMKQLTVVTRAQTVAQFLLNSAMWTNPVFLITAAIVGLVAGFVLLWKRSEAFRNFWIGLWEGIKSAVSAAWEGIIKPAWEGIKAGWDLLVQGISWAWNSILKPVFDFLATAARVVAAVLLTVLIAPAIIAWKLLSAAISWAWTTIIKPAWDALSLAAQWLWTAVLMPVFGFIRTGFDAVGALISWVWTNVIKPAWDGWATMAGWLWNTILSPVFGWIKAGFDAVGSLINWVWTNVIKPVWEALGRVIEAVWTGVVSPVFDSLKKGVDLVGKAFEAAVDFIGRMWDRIKAITAKPVKFVIDTVYNDGIRAVWNKVAGWLSLDELPEWRPDWLGAYAAGGVLPGYTPGRDVHRFVSPTGGMLDLSGGEAIMRPEWTRAVGGAAAVEEMNERARRGLPLGHAAANGGVLSFAGGGILPGYEMLTTDIQRAMAAAVARAFPNQVITSGTRYQDVGAGFDNHMAGRAIDFGPSGALAAWIAREYPNTLELFWDPGPNLKNGAPTGAIGGHSDHVHWAMAQIIDPYTGDVISHDGPGGGGGMSTVASLVSAAFSEIIDPIIEKIPDFGDGPFGQMPKALSQKIVDGVRDFLLSKVGGSAGADYTPGTGPVADQVREAFAAFGWDQEPYWSAVDYIVSRESSWNPTAVNPSSGAFGLFQFNPMGGNTLGAYLPDRNPNPRVQGNAGARYIRDRYGDPLAARAFWEANGWYDQGGVLPPGVTLAVNESGKPEAILTNRQWRDVSALVDELGYLTPELRHWVDFGLAELERFANAAEEMRPAWDEFVAGIGPNAQSKAGDELAEFFGFGGVVSRLVEIEAAFNPKQTPAATTDPVVVADTDTDDPTDGVDGGEDGGDDEPQTGEVPLVVVEQMVTHDPEAAGASLLREARRAVRSNALVGGWV